MPSKPTSVAYVWTLEQSETTPAPKPLAGNPKNLGIRGRDLIALYGIQAPYRNGGAYTLGYWADLCSRLPTRTRIAHPREALRKAE